MSGTNIDKLNHQYIDAAAEFSSPMPLWQRVPTHTEAGELAFDFMVFVKKLNKLDSVEQTATIDKIYSVLNIYSKVILLADLNLKINLLWVSHLPRLNLSIEIASQIINVYPPARLISHRSD